MFDFWYESARYSINYDHNISTNSFTQVARLSGLIVELVDDLRQFYVKKHSQRVRGKKTNKQAQWKKNVINEYDSDGKAPR